jgi:hypothetical protein
MLIYTAISLLAILRLFNLEILSLIDVLRIKIIKESSFDLLFLIGALQLYHLA